MSGVALQGQSRDQQSLRRDGGPHWTILLSEPQCRLPVHARGSPLLATPPPSDQRSEQAVSRPQKPSGALRHPSGSWQQASRPRKTRPSPAALYHRYPTSCPRASGPDVGRRFTHRVPASSAVFRALPAHRWMTRSRAGTARPDGNAFLPSARGELAVSATRGGHASRPAIPTVHELKLCSAVRRVASPRP